MKLFRHILFAVLALTLGVTASAQGYWQWVGNSFQGVPHHQRVDYTSMTSGSSNYYGHIAQIVDYDVWAEGNSIAYKENYVGSYYASVQYRKNGKTDGESHNHKGEFASAHLALPYPPPILRAGEKVKWTLTFTRNTSCGWKYGKPQAAVGKAFFYAGNKLMATFDTDKSQGTRQSMNISFKMGAGAANGAKLSFTFLTAYNGKTQAVVYNYVWVKQ